MTVIRHQVNEIIEQCARAAERGGPAAIRAMKIPENDLLPPRPTLAGLVGCPPAKGDDHEPHDVHL